MRMGDLKVARVRAHSRLHFGIIDVAGSSGRKYVCLGLYIHEPSCLIDISLDSSLKASGVYSEDFLKAAEKFLYYSRLTTGINIRIIDAIPRHVGLGSGTQHSLAVALGIAKLTGIDFDPIKTAILLGRGRISGVGTYAFKSGGFIIDSGKPMSEGDKFPGLLLRYNFPEEWHIVIVIPKNEKGLYGEEELVVLKHVEHTKVDFDKDLCRIIVMKLLPGILEKDIHSVGQAIEGIQKKVGKIFEDVQGGIFRKGMTSDCIKLMKEGGLIGVGQSSWGPVAYGITERRKIADEVAKMLMDSFRGKCKVLVTKARNLGASVELLN